MRSSRSGAKFLVTPIRETRLSDNSAYNRGVVNGFLESLDGLNRRDGVLVIATTNEVDVIDPAILRAGRIDTHIEITLPDAEARFGILERYLGLSIPDGDKPTIERATERNSGADLEVLARKAHRLARAAGVATSIDHLFKALPKVMALPVERHRANALHEAGHAVIGLAVGRTIVDAWLSDTYSEDRQLQSMGMVRFETQRLHRRTCEVIFGELLIALAGIAAEIVITGWHDEGAAGVIGSDLEMATRLATTLEAVNAMGDTLVSEPYRGESELRRIRQTNSIIWQRVEKTLHMALDQAKALIRENLEPMHAIAQELLRAKALTGDEIHTLLSNKSLAIAMVEAPASDGLRRSA
ncbi:AAA family ATPase [Rhizobium sp. TH2]|uniref:AAA family ATPase n=1 Tax=Rhizobium sp. TH2 TaxID=2775403 RepID=UPI0021582C74|nr:AAA family ATPase [Rhizobium sp. TH2]UVC06792.1 AAA family ATPase [Rhizobium sp. TH2]